MLISTNLLPYSTTSISPRKTTVLSSSTTENDIKQSDQTKLKPLENPTVQKALKRWLPESKEILVFGSPNDVDKKKQALSFLADPTKLGVTNFVLWTTFWSTGWILWDYAVQLTGKRIGFFSIEDIPSERSLIEFIKKNPLQVGISIVASASCEILGAITVAHKQKKTNKTALKAIKNNGINAKFSDADKK
jgi:hypothetical protein